jgi:predicted helicase
MEKVASLAHQLRDAILQAWAGDDATVDLCRLLPDMTLEQRADVIAQLACCGLFVARCNRDGDVPFVRTHLIEYIPFAHPLLHALFSYLADPDLDARVACVVDKLIEALSGVDSSAVNGRSTSQDALSRFYESFLAFYDAAQRGLRGVYYTPEPVISYIVRSVDCLLKTDFALPDGLVSVTPHILDPAVGTGAFLRGIIAHIHQRFQGDAGQWQKYVACNLLPRLSGCELLATPYAIAYMQLALQLAETGYDLRGDACIHLSLANALEDDLVMNATCSPILMIVGNPPYAGHSTNDGAWINALLHGEDRRTGEQVSSYFEADGIPLHERNAKWLNDDYVKFMRYAQWRIEHTGAGILAFVTNHGYLENPTFRGMRRSLMQSFDAMYVLDLHGNSKKNARAHNDVRDENVFDIRQGIAISIFVRRMLPAISQSRSAIVHHTDLWGTRANKYHWLATHDVTTTPWAAVEPAKPFYLFVPRNADQRAEYERGWPITAIMPVNSLGILTKRDALTVGFTEQELLQKIAAFADSALSDAECAAQFGVPLHDKDTWDIANARTAVRGNIRSSISKPVAYRPLDTRFVYYDESLVARRNMRVMQHMEQPNRALVLGRQGAATGANTWDVLFTVSTIADQNIFRRGGGTVFPLYLYNGANHQANFSPAFIEAVSTVIAMQYVPAGTGDLRATFGPEDVFNYLYAILHSSHYRSRYADFLKIDFPRVPLPENADYFRALCPLGARLVALHTSRGGGGGGGAPARLPGGVALRGRGRAAAPTAVR